MVEPFLIDADLVLPGHAATPGAARMAAHQWLIDHGHDEFDAEAKTDGARVSRAWYTGAAGFVQADHPGAGPVTVVHLPGTAAAAP